MKNIIKRFSKSSFLRNVAVMATGTAGAQAVTLILSPVITRLYGPDTFGILGTFTALTRVIIPVAALTYPMAIVLPKDDKSAKSLMKLSLYITFIISLIATSILFFFQSTIVDIFNIKEIASFLYLIPLVILFAGFMQVTEQWLIRTNQFSINAKASFLQSALTNSGKVGIGFIYPSAIVLVILQTAGNGIKAFLMIFFAKKSKYKKGGYYQKNSILTVKDIANKYRDFPLYRAPEEFFGAISQNIPILLLTSFFGPSYAGFYTIGRNVLTMPSKLIGKSIGDVFYPRIAQAANNKENLSRLIIQATVGLGVIGVIPFGIVIAFGPYLFEFVFGAGWEIAGEYARWIALTSFSMFMSKPSVKAIPVLAVQRFYLIFSIVRMIVRISAFIIGLLIFKSDIIAIVFLGSSGALMNFVLMLLIIKWSNKLDKIRFQGDI